MKSADGEMNDAPLAIGTVVIREDGEIEVTEITTTD